MWELREIADNQTDFSHYILQEYCSKIGENVPDLSAYDSIKPQRFFLLLLLFFL
jgi:hypothetical protein